MIKVCLIDQRRGFLEDFINTYKIESLNGERIFRLVKTFSREKEVEGGILMVDADIIIANFAFFDLLKDMRLTTRVKYYATNPVGEQDMIVNRKDNYGIIGRAVELVEAIKVDQTLKAAPNGTQKSKIIKEDTPTAQVSKYVSGTTSTKMVTDQLKKGQRRGASLKDQIDEHSTQTKTYSFFSAKGGVGKTTISTEVAAFLARLESNRVGQRGRKNKVCIVDFNIAFGNVATSLNFDFKGRTITQWAAEIRERVNMGEDPNTIFFNEEEIKNRLQYIDELNLYGLIAPVEHLTKYFIGRDEMIVILKSIIMYGGFDYVIIDMENSTNDQSMIAQEMSDEVFLIFTQDSGTISANASFIETVEKTPFDTSKFKMVVNMARSAKLTGIAVEDIGRAFNYIDLIAVVKQNEEVTGSNNRATPLSLNESHSVTKDLIPIIQEITGVSEIKAEKKEKKGFFSRFMDMLGGI